MGVVRALGSVWLRPCASALALLLLASCGVDNAVPPSPGGDAGDDPWAAPLTFTVDESLRPSADSVGTLDGKERRVEALASPDGETMELLVDELIVGTVDDAALAPLLERRGGEVLWKVEGSSATEPGFSLVHIEPGPGDAEGVASLLRDMGDEGVGLEGGEQRVSHRDVIGLLVTLLEEASRLEVPVSPNIVMSLATVGDGTTVEADDLGSTALTRDACTWPHMKSGGAQDIGVCDAWRLLVQQGKTDTRVEVGVIDQGFAATLDTPQGSTFEVPGMVYDGGAFWAGPPGATSCSDAGDCRWHGTWTSSALSAVPDNAWGSAGPGGLNARIQHIDPLALLSNAIRTRLGSGPLTLDQFRAGLAGATTERLPQRSVAYVGIASHMPWPFSVFVERAMDPVFARARAAGILVFAPAGKPHDVDQMHVSGVASGKGWETALTFPCELSGVVCVGGLGRDENGRDAKSGYGSKHPAGVQVSYELGSVDLYGPGTVAVGPDPSDAPNADSSLLRERRGTSLAAAFTAGVAVQVWAADPTRSPEEVEQILLDTMHTGSSSPEVVGWVDAFAAVESAACPTPAITRYRDADGDGYGDPASADDSCLPPVGYVEDNRDCDDTDDGIFPGAEERCDGVDQNCDPSDEQGLACDDDLFCTRDDVCDDGECTGSGSPCRGAQRCDEDADDCVSSGCSADDDCVDDVYCNGDETCDTDSGDCDDGSRQLSDGVSCTDDSCSEGHDRVDHAPNDASCDDGVFCNGAETCDADDGCQAGTNPCPDNVCDEDANECGPCFQDADCDDDLFCNGVETCNIDAGTCIHGTAPALSDAVSCTIDTCDEPTDGIVHTVSNAACDDGTFCNGAETCDATLDCQPGTAPTLDDAVDCTTDSCNESTNRVQHLTNNATCDDGLYCNGPELCSATLGCQPGSPPGLSDSVACTNDSCNEATDSLVHAPSNAACDDGLFCNGAETCNAASGCQPGTAPTLSDSVSCTTDSCNETTNSVVHVTNDAACNDGQYCTGDETCHATLGCQDGNPPCAASICDEGLNFCDLCASDQECDDGLYCNGVESCNENTGVCLSGVAPSPADQVDCTVDSCDESTDGFVHTPDDTACTDALYCNGAERCDELLDCRAGTPPSAADAIACTSDTCDESTDSIVHTPVNSLCNDSLYCTGAETCSVTLGCQSSGNPCGSGHCNDTLDACVACLVNGHCADGQFCNGVELCNVAAGTCGPGSLAGLDDGIACTTDSCNESNDSISHTPVNSVCNDSQYCTGTETCSATLGCQDGPNPCIGGCTEANDTCFACNQNSDCNDGAYCNGTETCNTNNGMCVPGTGPVLTDGVPCTVDSCNETTNSVDHLPSNAFCSNGAFCDGAEVCSAVNGCQAGTAPVLSDGVSCTTDSCNEANDSVDHVPNAGSCSNGLFCDGAEVCSPVNGCQAGTAPALSDGVGCTTDSCVEATDTITHTPNAGSCSDGLFCDGAEICHATLGCQVGTPPVLSDGVTCTLDSCDEANDTVDHTPDAASCSDGLFCDGAETCHVTLGCQAGTPPALSDGVDCTADSCDEGSNSVVHAPNDGACDDALFCNGAESCELGLGCAAGVPPATSDSVACTVDACVEASDTITHAPSNAACNNGLFCDGAETCHVTLGCQAGSAPALSDGVPCTTDACNESADTIDHTPNDGACSDGAFCTGAETCDASLGCQSGSDPCPSLNCDEGMNACTGCAGAGDCDDLDPCTIDICTVGTCGHSPSPQYYADGDGDTFGGAFLGCVNPGGAVTVGGDCNDSSASIRPNATESCNSVDDDCDGVPDDGLTVPYYSDADGDGYGAQLYGFYCSSPGAGTSALPGDCNDGASTTHPGATELCDSVDNDCDGTPDDGLTFVPYYTDLDGDTFGSTYYGSFCSNPGSGTSSAQGDCNDSTSVTRPGATELCDSLDNDCDGVPDDGLTFLPYYADLDGDGYGSTYGGSYCSDPGAGITATPGDCNDGAGTTHPGATELCDSADNDCDGVADDGVAFTNYYLDLDGDGYGGSYAGRFCSAPGSGTSATQGDCNDGTSTTHPGASELCDSIDNDCDGTPDDGLTFLPYYNDTDGDGYGGTLYGYHCNATAGTTANPGDCNDGSPSIHPGVAEVCDDLDNDCDGTADDGLTFTAYYDDLDHDGCGGLYYGSTCDTQPSGTVTDSSDCAAPEDGCECPHACSPTARYYDVDGDGYGGQYYGHSCGGSMAGTTATPGDCNDNASNTHPLATELCDGNDNDCDGAADDGLAFTTYYYDVDGDDSGNTYYDRYCGAAPSGVTDNPGDCNDNASNTHLGATELCDGNDNDCDGLAEDGLTFLPYYYDVDGDGYGATYYGSACSAPGGGTVGGSFTGDCDDGAVSIRPGATELCDGNDNDCDGVAEDGLVFTTYYYDVDGDGTGSTRYGRSCSPPGGATSITPGDCNDGTATIEPGAPELCDGNDNDCDGLAEDGLTFTTYYYDVDGDGTGSTRYGQTCSPPGGATTSTHGDCNDGSVSIEPGAPELCDSYDNDCDGIAEDGLTFLPYFDDDDHDDYGGAFYAYACTDPGGSTAGVAGDCNDSAGTTHPGAPELCDDLDNDCDGPPDEGCP